MQRRTFLLGAGVTSATILAAQQLWQSAPAVAEQDNVRSPVLTNLERVCDLVIPATDTPGAAEVGVAGWVVRAAESGLLGFSMPQLEAFLSALEAPKPATAETRLAKLTQIDQSTFVERATEPLNKTWSTLKTLILTGYYTSEVGASQELRYQLVPGQLLPAVPVEEGETKAWSSDWTAVNFG